MPTLPLFVSPESRAPGASPDAWHRVTAPGGYEWWHFDAEDATGDLRLVAGLFDGFPFHPGYLRAHARYLRRPTRVAPAVPSQYPCVAFAVYEKDRALARFTTQYPQGAFTASDERLDVRVGPNALQSDDSGAFHLAIQDENLTAELTFRPLLPSLAPSTVAKRFLSRDISGADHFRLIANPLCDVTGTVRIPGAGDGPWRVVEIQGRGFHEHRYGSGPLGAGVRRWIRGRAFFGEQVRTFEIAEATDRHLPDEDHLSVIEPAGVRDVAVRKVLRDVAKRARWGLSHTGLEFHGPASGDGLRLNNGRVIDSTPFSLRLLYDATDGCHLIGGRALCDIIYPGRLVAPGVGRMVEMSIGQRGSGVPSAK